MHISGPEIINHLVERGTRLVQRQTPVSRTVQLCFVHGKYMLLFTASIESLIIYFTCYHLLKPSSMIRSFTLYKEKNSTPKIRYIYYDIYG